MSDRFWDREREERGRRYRGEGYYGGYYDQPEREREREWSRRGEERGFFDRAGDEVRSWFGDEDAHRRRQRDEREERGRWGERRGGWGERGWGEGPRGADVDRDWARQWGYAEGRGGPREAGSGWERGGGPGGGYGPGSGYRGGRGDWGDWSGSGGYEPGAAGSGWRGQGSHELGGSTGHGWRGASGQGPHVGRGPRGYRRSDERIREDICEQMSQCGDLDASEIDLAVAGGEVTLQGSVPDRASKRLAEELAEQVSGVREVNNQLRVTPAGGQQQDQQNRPFRAA